MVELSRNARVAVRNPSKVVGYSAPRSIEGRILARGPAGPSGGPIPVGGTAGQVVTPDGFGDYVWTTVGAILGLSGNAVGTSDVQVLTNKDLSSATNTFPSTLVTTSTAQVVTNKDLSSGTNTFPSSLATDAELSAHSDATAAHGATGAVVGTTNTQTLTNKTLTAPTLNDPRSAALFANSTRTTPPRGKMSLSAAQSVANATLTQVQWNLATKTGQGVTTDTTNYTLQADHTGWHAVTVGIRWSANTTGVRLTYIYLNGSLFTQVVGTSFAWEGDLVAGDNFSVRVYQTNGSAIDVLTDSYFTMRWVCS